MTYAVLQTGLVPPSAEQLAQAFRAVPGLTAMDAARLGQDACGVLMPGLEADRAATMQSGLAAQGIETEVVDEAALPVLPQPRQLTKAQFTPEALRIDDLLGRGFYLEWNTISVIAAGRARLTDFTTELVDKVVMRPAGRKYAPKVVTEAVTREEQNDHLLLEILTHDGAVRYHTMADRPETLLLFQCLGERRRKDPAANLALLVRDLAKFAPGAALNQGAFLMRENGDFSFLYPSKTAFYREIIWLLWLISSGRLEG